MAGGEVREAAAGAAEERLIESRRDEGDAEGHIAQHERRHPLPRERPPIYGRGADACAQGDGGRSAPTPSGAPTDRVPGAAARGRGERRPRSGRRPASPVMSGMGGARQQAMGGRDARRPRSGRGRFVEGSRKVRGRFVEGRRCLLELLADGRDGHLHAHREVEGGGGRWRGMAGDGGR